MCVYICIYIYIYICIFFQKIVLIQIEWVTDIEASARRVTQPSCLDLDAHIHTYVYASIHPYIYVDLYHTYTQMCMHALGMISDFCTCQTSMIHTWSWTHLCVRHDSFMCETWLIYVWDMTYPNVRNDTSKYETWLIHVWDLTHLCVWHDPAANCWWLPTCPYLSVLYGLTYLHTDWLSLEYVWTIYAVQM